MTAITLTICRVGSCGGASRGEGGGDGGLIYSLMPEGGRVIRRGGLKASLDVKKLTSY